MMCSKVKCSKNNFYDVNLKNFIIHFDQETPAEIGEKAMGTEQIEDFIFASFLNLRVLLGNT